MYWFIQLAVIESSEHNNEITFITKIHNNYNNVYHTIFDSMAYTDILDNRVKLECAVHLTDSEAP